MSWKRIKRKTIYENPFLTVFEDKIELPNGNVHEKYSVFKLPDIVVIVPTTKEDDVVTITEYKYAPDTEMRSFPAGYIEEGEDILLAAKRELLEETGYAGDDFKLVGIIREVSTKNLGKIFVVRAKNVEKVDLQRLDENEALDVQVISRQVLHGEVSQGKWQLASPLAAIALTGIINY